MPEDGYLLTPGDHARVGRAVRRGELDLIGQPPPNVTRIPQGTITHVLQLQSGAANAFGYPARVQEWDNEAGTWSDIDTTEVRVADPGGGGVEAGYITARLLGVNDSGVACYAVTGFHPGHAIVTSATTVSGRYPALRLIETGRPSEWPAAEQVWLDEINSRSLYAGRRYQFTKYNTDTFVGSKQAGTVECCSAPTNGCGCDLPDYMCMWFTSDCLCLDGAALLLTAENLLHATTGPRVICSTGVTVAITCAVDQWLLTLGGAGGCAFIIDDYTVDCGPPFEVTGTGTIASTGACGCLDNMVFSVCGCTHGTAFSFTISEVADPEDCAASGSGSNCIVVNCDPFAAPSSILLTFARTSGTGGTGDGQEATMYPQTETAESTWIASGTLDSEEFYVVLSCAGGAWSTPTIYFPNLATSFAGTFTETSPGIWTILIENIDISSGARVYQVGGSFDEDDC